jgi:hypothetical protein
LRCKGLSASIGSVGDACDNALAVSIIGLFTTEVVRRSSPFKTLAEVEYAVMGWVDWYNNARLRSRLGATSLLPSTRLLTTLNTRHADRRWSDTESGPLLVTVQFAARRPSISPRSTGLRLGKTG